MLALCPRSRFGKYPSPPEHPAGGPSLVWGRERKKERTRSLKHHGRNSITVWLQSRSRSELLVYFPISFSAFFSTIRHISASDSIRYPQCPSPTKLCKRYSHQASSYVILSADIWVWNVQLLQEIEAQAITSAQQLNITKAQITAKQKNIRLLELTSKEIGSLPKETKVYEGVGKM